MQERPWSSVDYLRSVAGPGRIVPVEVGKDYRNDDWTQKLMNWDEFLESIDFPDRPSRQTPGDVLYLAQHNLLTQFPALRADIVIPDYLYACPSCPVDFPAYKPPANEEQFVLNAWLGPKGTISPAHTVRTVTPLVGFCLINQKRQDPYFNFYGISSPQELVVSLTSD
jgi:lysine-specific demethylase 8